MKAPRFLAVLPLLSLANPALAQVDGRIVGTVTELDSGRPLPGAVVAVDGLAIHAVSDDEGYYFLNRIPPGERTIGVSHLGYASRSRTLRIFSGHIATLDFELARAPVEAEPVIAVVEREAPRLSDHAVSRTRFTGEEAARLPTGDIDEVIALSAGVYQGQDGFIIRGGRGSEAAVYVDGVRTTSFATQRDLLEVGAFAVEEIDVVTGAFGARFGQAQSGVVQIVTRSGGSRLHGRIRYTTDGRFSTDGLDADELAAIEREPCCGYHSLQAALSGPLVAERWTASGSLELTGAADIDPRAGGFNPTLGRFNSAGSTDGILPGNRGDRTRLHLKTIGLVPGVGSLSGTFLFSRDQSEGFDAPFGLGQTRSGGAVRTRSWDAIVALDRPIFRTAAGETSLRVTGHLQRSETHTGVPRSRHAAEALREILEDACGAECDVSRDDFDSDFLNWRFGDVHFFFEDSLPASVAGFEFGRATGLDPVFGVARVALDAGLGHAFSHIEERRATVHVDLDSQLDRSHRLQAGAEWTWIDLERRAGWLHIRFLADFYRVDPVVGAAYLQHRWDAGDFVVDLGLRWDHWNPRTTFPTIPGRLPCELAEPGWPCTVGAATSRGRVRNALSPRLAVAHPATDRTQVRVAFGRFHQLPELRHYFRGHRMGIFNALNGNPQLDHIQTTSLEMGLTHLLSEDTLLDLVAYHRDRRGAVRAEWFQPGDFGPVGRDAQVFVNGDNGNVKGLDLTLTHRVRPYLRADLAWSLQWARGTTSSSLEWLQTFGSLVDPLDPARRLLPPTGLWPDSYDRLHAFDGRVTLQLPARSGGLGARLLSNLGAYFVYATRSGVAYTRTDRDGFPVGDLKSSRTPWTHEGHLRVVKGLAGPLGTGLDVFVVIHNLFGGREVLGVHSTTGTVDRDGFEFELSRNPVIPRSFLLDDAPAGFPLPLDAVRPEHRETIGRQDRDGDGLVSLAEAQLSVLEAVVGYRSDVPGSYGAPRQVRFGVELRF